MKISLLLILLFSFSLFSQQHYYTFSELKGMEDNSGNTHLFYRLFYLKSSQHSYKTENSIYHLDLVQNIDTLFLFDGGGWIIVGDPSFTLIKELEFWNNDPSKFIYLGEWTVVDPVPYIKRFDYDEPTYSGLGEAFNLELGKQNDSLIIATAPNLIKSTDGGFSWAPFLDSIQFIVSISPFNDDEMYFRYCGGDLLKTTNGGNTITLVDTAYFFEPQLFYDPDSIHIYNATSNSLRVSDNRGNAFSWTERYSSSNQIYVSIDYSQSGKLYLADGRRIYVSENYGLTFSEFKVLDRKIVGIYKKPNSDIVYAATKYDLYEITLDSMITLKHLPLNPDILSWFPLQVGNKWIYNSKFLGDTGTEEHTSIREVTNTFHYKGKVYFQMNEESIFSYLIDSTSGKIYKAYFYNDSLTSKELYLDLTAEFGDTFYVSQFNYGYPVLLENEETFNQWDINSTIRNFVGQSTPLYNFSLVKDIGLTYEFWWELVGYEHNLKGAVINGIIYGDTTVVAVEDEIELPTDFSLSQNYPNPFNPTTKIKFTIPNVEMRHASSLLVTLKVYDILGREISTLVNEEMRPGTYEVDFDASLLSSGIYFYKLQAETYSSTMKMIYLK